MDIQQIKYFSRVYEMRSFTQAADSLFISRQALRKSVARLAQEIGEPLFENRGNVPVSYTHLVERKRSQGLGCEPLKGLLRGRAPL